MEEKKVTTTNQSTSLNIGSKKDLRYQEKSIVNNYAARAQCQSSKIKRRSKFFANLSNLNQFKKKQEEDRILKMEQNRAVKEAMKETIKGGRMQTWGKNRENATQRQL